MKGWILSLGLFSLLFASSCNDEPTDPPCGDSLSDFTGTWNMNDHCGGSDFQYPLSITENTSGGIMLTNLGGLGSVAQVNASVSGGNFSFSQQVQSAIFTGNGSLNAGCAQVVISWSGGPNGNCSGTGSK